MPAERGSPPGIPAVVHTRRRKTLADLAAEQFGVVSRRELLQRGFTSSAIGDLTADGTLHRVTHGVYAVGHRHLTREGWWSVAVRAGGEDTLLSHRASTGVRGLLRAVSAAGRPRALPLPIRNDARGTCSSRAACPSPG